VLVTGAVRAVASGVVAVPLPAALLGLGAGATYALYTIFSKIAVARIDTWGALFWSFGFASIALLFVAPPVEPLTRMPAALPRLLALGLVPTLFAYALYLRALRELRASTASMLAAIEPVVATLLGAAFFAERIALEQVIGIVLIVGGAAVIARRAAGATEGV
jgi:drug/metabolite transporter (DMT)-like permease